MSTKTNQFPDGWDLERVQQVLSYYEEQTEEEAVAEDEKQTMMAVPVELILTVRKLLVEYYGRNQLPTRFG